MHYGPAVVQGNMEVCVDALNPKSGSAGTDISGAGNTINLVNSPTHNSDGYWDFDGVNENLSVTNNSYPAAWTDDFSLEVWMYYPTGNTWSNGNRGCIFSRGSYGGSHGLWRHGTDNVVSARVRGDSGSKERTVSISRDTWTHLVMTWDYDSLLAVYKNGELGQSYDPASYNSGTPEDSNWTICNKSTGGGSQSTYYDGRLALARMYKKALTAAEVLQNFNATRGRFGV